MRRCIAWFVAIPLMLAGSQVAHALAYRLVYPDAHLRWQVLVSTGHDYLSYWPLLFGVAGGALVVGFAASAAGYARRLGPRPLPPWAFAFLPLVGFTIQEFMERWLVGGPLPWWFVLQPTYRIGMALQLPFALAAFLIARVLLRVAKTVADALRGAPAVARSFAELPLWFVLAMCLPRTAGLAAGHAGRGPPAAGLRPAASFHPR